MRARNMGPKPPQKNTQNQLTWANEGSQRLNLHPENLHGTDKGFLFNITYSYWPRSVYVSQINHMVKTKRERRRDWEKHFEQRKTVLL